MKNQSLDIRFEGFDDPIGRLGTTDGGDMVFAYADNYLSHPDRMPLSLSLPLTTEPSGDQPARAFFDNLLPENDQLNRVREREGLDPTDTVGLLAHLGADCPGAISCVPAGTPPLKCPGQLATDYDAFAEGELAEIVGLLADGKPLPDGMRDPSPLAGRQFKIAVTALREGKFGLPKKGLGVPTTHIVKVSPRGKGRDAFLETAAAQLAQAVGLEAVVPTPLRADDDVTALLIERFDRSVDLDGNVRRLHQEDFAQALGLGGVFDAAAIAGLLDRTTMPAETKRKFLGATFFNLMIGNTANHAKNHALLYDRGAIPRLAPLYDLVPLRLDPTGSPELAFDVGAADHVDKLTRADVDAFLAVFGLTRRAAPRFVADSLRPLAVNLDRASADLAEVNLKDLDDLIGREIGHLAEVLGLSLTIRSRDVLS